MKKIFLTISFLVLIASASVYATQQTGTVDRFVPSTGYKVNHSSLAMRMENATKNATRKTRKAPTHNNMNQNTYNNNNNVQKQKSSSGWT